VGYVRNHILSAGYIRNWVDDNGLVGCHVKSTGNHERLSPRDICMRRNFYAATPGPDGRRSADIAEKERHRIETAALPLIASLDETWPLVSESQRATIALWMAMTHVGSPASRGDYPHDAQRFWDELVRTAPAWFIEFAEREKHELFEPDFWLWSMFLQVAPIASALGMMHWTLVRFSKPLLVSGDHPIHHLQFGATRAGTSVSADAWFFNSVEVRMPISPTAALLLTWADRDDNCPAVPGRNRDAKTLNQAVWAHADQHIFWSSEADPVRPPTDRDYKPISSRIVPGYSPLAPMNSLRRRTAVQWIKAIDEAGEDWERIVATMHRDAQGTENPYRIVHHFTEAESLLPEFPDRGRTPAPSS
jgi:hypothetical protein